MNSYLMCAPDYYSVDYEINPWMSTKQKPDLARAKSQWKSLYDKMIELGVGVKLVPPIAGLPDMVFTANAGLVYKDKAILTKFKHQERAGEERWYEKWFEENNYKVLKLKSGNYEGEGDSLFCGEKLFCGYGFRSDQKAYDEIGSLLRIDKLITVNLIDPRFYHLDTCFCPLNNNKALFVYSAFSRESIKLLESEIELIQVPEEDALKFCCNAVVVNDQIIMPQCESVPEILKSLKITPHQILLDQFLKAGGSAKCLSLKLMQ